MVKLREKKRKFQVFIVVNFEHIKRKIRREEEKKKEKLKY